VVVVKTLHSNSQNVVNATSHCIISVAHVAFAIYHNFMVVAILPNLKEIINGTNLAYSGNCKGT
jgi:hypothetical protein